MDQHPLEAFWGAPEELSSLPAGDRVTRAADHKFGVAFLAPWEEPYSGFPEHARRSALALDAAGVPTHLRSFDVGQQLQAFAPGHNEVEAKVKHLLDKSIARYAAMIHMFVPTDTRLHNTVVHARMPPEELRGLNAHRILYNVWERQNVSPAAVTALNQVAQVWVACRDNAAMLARCGVDEDRIRVVPLPWFPGDKHLELANRPRAAIKGLPNSCVRFYHIEKWEPRKEGRNIIRAFLRAFQPGDARLYFKSSMFAPKYPDSYPLTPEHAVHECLNEPNVAINGWRAENVNQGIALMKTLMTEEELLGLHRKGDVYVTMSRGEGWDMPAFDAKLSGRLMVYVPSGGPQDFASPEDVRVPATGVVPCSSWYEWGTDARYLDYRIENAVAALQRARRVVLNGAVLHELGRTAIGPELNDCRADVVGRKMRSYVEQVAGGSFDENQ